MSTGFGSPHSGMTRNGAPEGLTFFPQNADRRHIGVENMAETRRDGGAVPFSHVMWRSSGATRDSQPIAKAPPSLWHALPIP